MPFVAGQKVRASQLQALEDASSSVPAEYNASGSQSIPHSVDTVVAFGTANLTSPLVTRNASGSGHTFTLNRAGRWALSATVRLAASGAARECYVGIQSATGGGTFAGNGFGTNVAVPSTLNPAVTRYFAAGSTIWVVCWQSSGAALGIDPTPGWARFNLTWLGP